MSEPAVTMFAEPDDLASFIGDTIDDTRATLMLTLATELVRATSGQTITRVDDDVIEVDPLPRGLYAFLPELPIIGVSLIEQLDRDGSTWVELAANEWRWHRDGTLNRTSRRAEWTCWGARLRVTYSHGYADVPLAVRAVTLSIAARLYANPLTVTQEAVGSRSASYRAILDDDEQMIIGGFALGRVG